MMLSTCVLERKRKKISSEFHIPTSVSSSNLTQVFNAGRKSSYCLAALMKSSMNTCHKFKLKCFFNEWFLNCNFPYLKLHHAENTENINTQPLCNISQARFCADGCRLIVIALRNSYCRLRMRSHDAGTF